MTEVAPQPRTPGTAPRSVDGPFFAGLLAYAIPVGSAMFLHRLPEVARGRLLEHVFNGRAEWGALALALCGAIAVGWAVATGIGTERLNRAWSGLKALGPVGVLGLFATVFPPLGSVGLLFIVAHTDIEVWMRANLVPGLAAYALAFAVLAGLALLPTYAQSILGGYAFGLMFGVPAALLGFVGGAAIGYAVARRASGDRVEKMLARHEKWRRIRDALAGEGMGTRGFWRTVGLVSLIRLPPNSPFAITNLVLASLNIPRGPVLLGTLIGMLPRTTLAVGIGQGLKELNEDSLENAIPNWVVWVSIAGTVAIVALLGSIANHYLKKMAGSK